MQPVGIVMPCYNEAERLDTAALRDFAAAHPELSLCLVNDGSADRTGAVLRELAEAMPAQIQALDLAENRGKAEAVRQGVLALVAADRELFAVGYWDADLATPLTVIPTFADALAARPALHLVMGTRLRRLGANVERRARRHYAGRVFATAASMVLGVGVYDTQCGAKLIRPPLAARLFAEPFLSRWLFDVELLARLIAEVGRARLNDVVLEYPLPKWLDVGESRVRFADFLRAPRELWRIRRQYAAAMDAADAQIDPARGD